MIMHLLNITQCMRNTRLVGNQLSSSLVLQTYNYNFDLHQITQSFNLPSLICKMIQSNKNIPKVEPYFQTIVQPGKKYDCVVCQRDAGSFTFILAQNNIHCIPCFARLKKWPASYYVINKLEFAVFEDNWSALQQIYLFQGLEKHGLGNWNELADYIETNKTKDDVEKHYTQIYLNAPNHIPVPNALPQEENRLISRKNSNPKQPKNKHTKYRQTLTSKRIQSINMEKSISRSTTAEIIGFMPLRNDYEFEYDNQAELLLAEMEFNDEDTEAQKELKFKILDIYNKRLTQRNRKKQFVRSRGILDLEKQVQFEKTTPKQEKQIYNMMKIFSRFQISSDHDELIKGVIKQKQLRQKIEQYKELHRRGYRTIAEIEQEIQRKNETKTKKKAGNQYNFAMSNDARNNRRANHNSTIDMSIKKPSVYFTPEELQLLKNNKLSSISYMMIKQTLLREYAKLGTIHRESVFAMFNLQRFIVNNVIDYLESNQEIVCSQ